MTTQASEIKASYANNMPDMSGNPIAEKLAEALLSVSNEFWGLHTLATTPKDCLTLLRIMCSSGIPYKGPGFSDVMIGCMKTGEITYK